MNIHCYELYSVKASWGVPKLNEHSTEGQCLIPRGSNGGLKIQPKLRVLLWFTLEKEKGTQSLNSWLIDDKQLYYTILY
jgi:hypothetical protein